MQSAEIFCPGKMIVAVTAAAGAPLAGVFAAGYTVAGTSAQILPCGSSVVVYSLQASGVIAAPTIEQVCRKPRTSSIRRSFFRSPVLGHACRHLPRLEHIVPILSAVNCGMRSFC